MKKMILVVFMLVLYMFVGGVGVFEIDDNV